MNGFMSEVADAVSQEADRNLAKNSGNQQNGGTVSNSQGSAQQAPNPAEGQQATQQQEPVTGTQQQNVAAPALDDAAAAKYFREKYKLDTLSDQDLIARLTGTNGQGKIPEVPKPDEVSDDEVIKHLESRGKNKEWYDRVKGYKDLKDYDLAKLDLKAELNDPDMTDEELDLMLKEKYAIADADNPDQFTPKEKKVGAALLKREADRIRKNGTGLLDYTREQLKQLKTAEFESKTELEGYRSEMQKYLNTIPGAEKFAIGKLGEKDLGDYEQVYLPETIQKVKSIMETPETFAQYMADPSTGKVDPGKMFRMVMSAELLPNIIKSVANSYHSKGMEDVRSGLYNGPDLNNTSLGDIDPKKDVKKDAEDHNKKQVHSAFGGR